jgi:hypothetical protein
MTWRRFLALVRGLGPQSASASLAWSRRDESAGIGRKEQVRTITDPAEAERVFVATFAPPAGKASEAD